MDYRKLNKITQRLSWPLPRLDSILDTMAATKAQFFSKLDLFSGFWQLKLDPETKHYAAFITQDGSYEWKRLPRSG